MTMEERRIKAWNIFVGILGSENVYFDPPESAKIEYPAIIFSREKIWKTEADNVGYLFNDRFEVKFIRKTESGDIVDKLLMLPYCEHNRSYKASDMYHDAFTFYI